MRNDIAIIATLLLLSATSHAQQPGEQGRTESRFGGYFGTETRVTTVKGTTGVFVGGEFMMLVGHRFALGFGGYGLATDDARIDVAPGTSTRLGMGYGGLKLGYVARAAARVHPMFGLLIGDGEIARADNPRADDDVFVLEPSVSLEGSIAPAVRLGVGASYRFVCGVSLPGVSETDVRGGSLQIALRLGRF